MDDNYYSPKTVQEFERDCVCLKHKAILKAYTDNDVKKYRMLLKKYATAREVRDIVYVIITDCIRSVMRKELIPELVAFLKPYGELIISGGEAFNTFVDIEHRIITGDIDTKFIPLFKTENFFRNLQILKINFWEKLNEILLKFENKFRRNILKKIKNYKPAKMIGLTIPKSGVLLKRRYTLMMKTRTNGSTNKVSPGNTLIDVELFAIDMNVRYYDVETGKIERVNLGGVLDVAFMRPNEFGSEIIQDFSKDNIAGKRFFLDDLYRMQKLGLRPNKKKKDKDRMVAFARHVAGLRDVSGSFESLYTRSRRKIPAARTKKLRRARFDYQAELEKARKVNPLKMPNRIVQPSVKKVFTMAYGVKGPNGLNIKNYAPTYSNYRVNINRGVWVKNNSANYIRNEYNYRYNKNVETNKHPDNMPKPLYGYKTRRNFNIPRNIVNKSVAIQFARR